MNERSYYRDEEALISSRNRIILGIPLLLLLLMFIAWLVMCVIKAGCEW